MQRKNYRDAKCCPNCAFCLDFIDGCYCNLNKDYPKSDNWEDYKKWSVQNTTDSQSVCDEFEFVF